MSRSDDVTCIRCGRHLRELDISNVYVTDEGPTCATCIAGEPQTASARRSDP